ncbi:MAG TPA: glycoside hydrolase family 88 protein, partial [Polyangiaceae bacterium]
PTEHSFDTMQPAVLLPFLYEQTGQNKYAVAADNMRAVYDTIPKNSEGGYWHKQTYPNEMWLDSMYMGEPFLAKYGRMRATCGAFCNDTPVTQLTLIASHTRDTTTGLLYHAWDADRNATWANTTTGRSPIIWDRALGWYAMTLVDVLPYLPSNHPGRAQLLTILSSLAQGLQATQDSAGLWHQVVDQATRTDDFVESSGSAMFVYALKLASARGYIAASFADVAARGYTGLMGQVTMDATGPVINNAVAGMGVQVDYANYVNKMRLTNSSHGLCGILLAASAMESR